jgi:PAS domain S-box-containing protein
MSSASASRANIPLEDSIPEAGASLESILCTEELQRRPSRPPDYGKENRALVALMGALADSPSTILQTLADTILEITQSDSAGLSLLTKEDGWKRFHWAAIAGMWNPHVGGGTPRNFGPCGDVLDHNIPMLFTHWERRYPYLSCAMPLAEEGLLVPFYVGGKPVGTIWAIMHSDRRKFDAEDNRVMASLGKFASSAYQALVHMEDLKFQVAEREKAEAEVRELARGLEAKIRRLVEANVVGIVMWNLEGAITGANDAFLHMVQYDREDLASGRVRWTNLTPAEWRGSDERAIADLKACGVFQPFEKEYFRKDGSRVPILLGGALIEGGGNESVAFVLDLTARKRAERELLALRDELAAELTAMTRLHELSTHLLEISEFQPLLEEVLDATVALQNADFGNIQLYNPETQALEIVAQRGFHQDFLEYFGNVRDTGAACGRAMELRERIIIEDVETDSEFAPHRHVAASAGFRAVQSTPLFSRSGEFLGMLSTHFRRPHRPPPRDLRFTDLYARHAAEIIDRKRLDKAQRQAEQALHITQVALAHVSRLTTMGELAASIAHEINQPLTAVTNNSNACLRLLAARNLEPEVLRRALEEIVADGTRASAVLARIRAFIKKTPAQRNELDINEVIQEVLALAGHELDKNRVVLEHQMTKPLPLVLADRVQLQQVLLNLIMNGIEAMTGVTDRPRLLRVQTRIDESGDVLVAVSDSGTGLGLEADRVFTPFFTTKANGMGMGLPISRSLIEGHGGRLWATPNSPQGAVFSFTLQVAGRSSP